MAAPKKIHLTQYLSTNGDGTGAISAIGDYSAAAEEFYIQAPSGSDLVIHRMLVTIQDAGTHDADGYGNRAALTTGITVQYLDDDLTVLSDLSGGVTVKALADWATLCYDVANVSFGQGDTFTQARWSLDKHGLPLELKEGQSLRVTLNDSMVDLVGHKFVVQGYSEQSYRQG